MSFYLAEIRELRKDFVESYNSEDLKKALFLGKRLLEIYKENGEMESLGFAEDTHNVAVIFDELGFYSEALEYYQKAASLKEARSGETVSFADTLNNLAIAYSNLGQHEEALKTHIQALEVRDRKLGCNHIDYIYTLYNLGNTYEALKQYDCAIESHGQALEYSGCCKALQMMDLADIHGSLARCFEKKGNYKKAIFYYEFALDIIEKKEGAKSLHYITNALSLVAVCEKAEFIGLAVEYCERVVEIRRQMFPEGHIDYGNNLKYLATLCYKDCQFDKSLSIHKTGLELAEQIFGQNHPLYSDILDRIALDFCGKKDFANAQEYSQKALELRKKALSEEDVLITKSYMTMGKISDDMGDYAQALAYYEKALYIREKNIDENKSAIANTLCKIAQLFDHQGAYEAAAFLYEFTLKIRKSCFSIKNDVDISLMKKLAETRVKQEEYPRAVLICLEMEKIARNLYGKQHPRYATVLKYLGVAYQNTRDLAVAGKYLEEALTIQRETLDEDNPIYIQTLEAFAEICFQRGECTRAIQLYKERHDVNFEETSEEQREAACTLLAIGNCYLKLREKEKATAYLSEAEGKLKRSHLTANEKYNQLKEIYSNGKSGKFQINKPVRKRMRDGERRCLEDSISFLIQVYKTNADKMENEKKAYVAFSLGEMYQRLGKKDEAVYWYTVAEKESEPEYYVRACIRLGEAYLENGEVEKAFHKFINGKEYIAEYGDMHSWDYFILLGYIGDYFFKKGDKETALNFYHSWNQLHKELDLPDSVFYENRIEKMGRILTALERNKEAVDQYYTLAMSIRNREGETEKYAKMLLRIAMLYINLGDAKEAELLLDHVLILVGKSGITSERFGKVCDKVGRLYNAAGLEDKALEAMKLAYFKMWNGKKCITKEGLQLLLALLWKNGDFKTFFSIKNGSKME